MKLVFIIVDENESVWGLAPTKVQARRQIKWFLPKEHKYTINICPI